MSETGELLVAVCLDVMTWDLSGTAGDAAWPVLAGNRMFPGGSRSGSRCHWSAWQHTHQPHQKWHHHQPSPKTCQVGGTTYNNLLTPLHCCFVIIVLLFTGRICPKVSSAGILFTHGPILGFFAPQGWRVAPIKIKFGTEERTVGLLPAKFDLDRLRGRGLRPPKLKKIRILPI